MAVSVLERARRYVARMPDAVSGQGGHQATLDVAAVLVRGFDLPLHEARVVLHEFNARCRPPWSEAELEHKLKSADAHGGPRGYLLGDGEKCRADRRERREEPARVVRRKPEFDAGKLAAFAGEWARRVDLLWLANRSVVDPALCDSAEFLARLYEAKAGERVLVFTNEFSQGDAVWPREALPRRGPKGVWFLIQPVDGEFRPNPRSQGRKSRRIEECVTAFRYLCLESDQASARDWLGALVQLPLRIAAIYTSGRRSVHVLVRVDAREREEWTRISKGLQPGLVVLGADQQVVATMVRLSRLPGCWRPDGKGGERLQKLLYLNPEAPARPLRELPAVRDVRAELEAAAVDAWRMGIEDARRLLQRLDYYAAADDRLARHAKDLRELLELKEKAK